MKTIILILLVCITQLAMAADALLLLPGENINISCTSENPDECATMPANAHSVVHSKIAPSVGYDTCHECHQPGGEAVTQNQVGLCSQYAFRYPGIALINPVTGEILADPVSGTQVISGGKIAGYEAGMTVECKDCHFPHQRGAPEPSKKDIHTGCLDCHDKEFSEVTYGSDEHEDEEEHN